MDQNTIYLFEAEFDYKVNDKHLSVNRWYTLVPHHIEETVPRLQQLYPFPEHFPKVTTHKVYVFGSERECHAEVVSAVKVRYRSMSSKKTPLVVLLTDEDLINSLKTTGMLTTRKLKVTMMRKTQSA